jgi:hypothetical protein
MSDPLENMIKSNTEQFDTVEPPKGHRDRMRQRLQEEKDPVILKITRSQFWAAAAAIALVLTTTWWIMNTGKEVMEDRNELSLSELGQEMAQVETYYLQTISEKKELIASSDSDEMLVQSFFSELERLEEEYDELKKELARYPANERIIDSMINNYRMRIDILESLLERLQTRTENT